MPPKSSKANTHDDHKTDASHKDKNSNGPSGHHHHHHHHANGKMKRVASSAGSNLREVTTPSVAAAAETATAAGPSATQETNDAPTLDWASFDREILHAYRREFSLTTPTSFVDPYHQLLLCQSGSIGLLSPSMARKQDSIRQAKDSLALTTRKHFNSSGVQEMDVIASVLYKVKSDGITKRRRRPEQMPLIRPQRHYPK